MGMQQLVRVVLPFALAGAIASGCGGSSSKGSSNSASSSSSSALAADAKSAATGDIPDNQNFLTYGDKRVGFSIKYPEGWSQKKTATGINFQDKNNVVRVEVRKGSAPTVASVTADLKKLKATNSSLKAQAPKQVNLKAGPAIKVSYTTTSAPNPVTGKRVVLMVDRYELGQKGRVAVIDLGTPTGVDNVDAYRMMSESFTWR
ncbi:MAG: hypothetical protein QOI19_209 [Thermoleophilaceae bacterium]|nr:hypothetical protein [Thermoleophilaceae bacterium]